MKYALYEDPITHKFAVIALPREFSLGDSMPRPQADRWFETRDQAAATLRDLLDRDE
ncbi:MAG TPA: hypothetical protein VFP91_23240 [Vicinamibacterales bacterium]|nr:hypothetical protein [Vicinamibacterales bacterium]